MSLSWRGGGGTPPPPLHTTAGGWGWAGGSEQTGLTLMWRPQCHTREEELRLLRKLATSSKTFFLWRGLFNFDQPPPLNFGMAWNLASEFCLGMEGAPGTTYQHPLHTHFLLSTYQKMPSPYTMHACMLCISLGRKCLCLCGRFSVCLSTLGRRHQEATPGISGRQTDRQNRTYLSSFSQPHLPFGSAALLCSRP